jgi:glucosamine 6-phosphate synthetase-like amidotransferase/phosphosugar isomerase protein
VSQRHDPVRDQLDQLPDVIRTASIRLEEDTRSTLSTPEHLGLQLVVLTGCGDSGIAARGASFAWHELAGVPAMHLDAMTAARFYARHHQPWRPGGQLVLAVSSSGEVARTVEAAEEFSAVTGTMVCAATANPASPLAAAAGRTIDTSTGVHVSGPGLASYVVSLLGLVHLAIRCGEVRGRYTMDRARQLRDELRGTADAIATTVETAADAVSELASAWHGYDAIEFLGSGPARASAAFGAAKVLEAVGLRSMDQDVEEFMHLQYFERQAERTPTVLICPSASPARSRARSVADYLDTLRRPSVVLTDDPSSAKALTHAPTRELFAPIVHAAVLAALATELADRHGEVPGRGGTGQWADSKHGTTVKERA